MYAVPLEQCQAPSRSCETQLLLLLPLLLLLLQLDEGSECAKAASAYLRPVGLHMTLSRISVF